MKIYQYTDSDRVVLRRETAEELGFSPERVGHVIAVDADNGLYGVRFWKTTPDTEEYKAIFSDFELRPASMTAVWDTCEIWRANVQHYMEDEGMTEKEAENAASEADLTYEHEAFLEDVARIMAVVDERCVGWWLVWGWNLGWTKASGCRAYQIREDGIKGAREFLNGFLPETDCTVHMTLEDPKDDNPVLEISVSHHDAHGESYRAVAGRLSCDECGSVGFDVDELDTAQRGRVEDENLILFQTEEDRHICLHCLSRALDDEQREMSDREDEIKALRKEFNLELFPDALEKTKKELERANAENATLQKLNKELKAEIAQLEKSGAEAVIEIMRQKGLLPQRT